jgi:hypothetical protein
MNLSNEQLKKVGDSINIDWGIIPFDQFKKGIILELGEHDSKDENIDVVDSLKDAAKIAHVHLKESPEYYSELEKNEEKENSEPEDNVEFKKDIIEEEKPKCTKIHGGGLMRLLEDIVPLMFDLKNNLPTGSDANPFEVLEDGDFDDKDEVVKKFKDNHGGVKGIIKIIHIKSPEKADTFASILSDLQAVRKAQKLNSMRQIFAHVDTMKNNDKIAQYQLEATKYAEQLMEDADNIEEFCKLSAVKKSVLKGNEEDLDIASYRIRDIFASYVPKQNTRLAYTSLVTQEDEPYLLCPKARYQIGVAKPMEISKCRDNCIDSRTTNQGKTVCAYAEWLKIADNQNAVNTRLEVHRNPDNEDNLLNLNQGERTKKTTYNEKNYEQRLEEIKKVEIPEFGVEKRLDDASEVELGHHGEAKESIQDYLESKEKIPTPQKRQAGKKADTIDAESEDTMGEQIADSNGEELGDETIEAMLRDEFGGLNDAELDETVEMLLRQINRDK